MTWLHCRGLFLIASMTFVAEEAFCPFQLSPWRVLPVCFHAFSSVTNENENVK